MRRDAAPRIDPHLHVLDLPAAGIGAAREAIAGAEDRILHHGVALELGPTESLTSPLLPGFAMALEGLFAAARS